MKRFSIISLVLVMALAFGAPAFAGGAAGAYDNTDTDLALPGQSGERLCVNAIKFDATNATDDVNFYLPNGDSSTLTAAITAGGTTIAFADTTNAGIATNAQVLIVHPTGIYAETKALSAYDTVAAVDYAYPIGARIFELSQAQEWANVGTDPVTLAVDTGLFCAPRGQGIAAILDAGLMVYMSGFYTQ